MLVLEPGTSAGGAYFVPLAKWIVSKTHGWQVWSVERRENLVEDQSELNLAKQGKVTGTELFNYYLGFLGGREGGQALPGPILGSVQLREGLGHERRGAGPPPSDRVGAQARWKGRPRRSLARRVRRRGVRDVELRREAGCA